MQNTSADFQEEEEDEEEDASSGIPKKTAPPRDKETLSESVSKEESVPSKTTATSRTEMETNETEKSAQKSSVLTSIKAIASDVQQSRMETDTTTLSGKRNSPRVPHTKAEEGTASTRRERGTDALKSEPQASTESRVKGPALPQVAKQAKETGEETSARESKSSVIRQEVCLSVHPYCFTVLCIFSSSLNGCW